jgi:hypothetical protein
MPTPTPFVFGTPNTDIDLTAVQLVRDYLGLKSGIEDSKIQLCITAASVEWVWRTGRGLEGQVPAASPFVAPVAYDEVYDGNGSWRQILRNWPIVSVETLLINGQPFTQSSGFGSRGWLIDQSAKSLVIRTGGRQSSLGRACGGFSEGVQNVEVGYHAGFSSVPADIVKACTQMVAINYKRSEWLDIASHSRGATGVSGSTSYRAWAIPPEVAGVIHNYTRDAWA